MIYVDTSVLLAAVLSEDRAPPKTFWDESTLSSRLLEYEALNRLHAKGSDRSDLARAEFLLERIELLDLAAPILERAQRPFPIAVRTLDGLHLATACFVSGASPGMRLASYDKRMLDAAAALGLEGFEP